MGKKRQSNQLKVFVCSFELRVRTEDEKHIVSNGRILGGWGREGQNLM